jgi:prepilin-type N-terminal cleavage/methylation domain-containing protein
MKAVIGPVHRRPGFSLFEMLVALTLFGGLMTVALSVVNQQVKTFNNGSAGADAAQQLRFSMSVLDKHIANVGAGVPNGQPQVVYADTNVVVFNTNWMSNIGGDPFSVNVDSTMPNNWVMAVPQSRAFTIPTTAIVYPDTTYLDGLALSPAETVTFWFALDGSTPATNDYVLWRQVNDQTPEMVARNLLRPARGPFFRYYRHINPVSGSQRMDTVPASWLPLRHTAPIHGSATDTGVLARVDSVRAIDVAFQTSDNLPAPYTRTYSLSRTVALPNAGKEIRKTCGDGPLLQGSVNFTLVDTVVATKRQLALKWQPSVDEYSGEQDVQRYVIWRDTVLFAMGVVRDPFLSVAAGDTAYLYLDATVDTTKTYFYALAAQDCTPSLSNLSIRQVIF